MESQLPRPLLHNPDDHHTSVEGQDDEHHHGHHNKSVLKKVKAKAKKIQETLKKHGHGHDHDHDHVEHDEEEDENEEMEEDSEVHGAPMYESSAMRSGVAAQQPGVNLEKPTLADPPSRTFAQWQEENTKQPNAVAGRWAVTTPAAQGPQNRDISITSGAYGTKLGSEAAGQLGTLTALEVDPQAPKGQPEPSNYQSKVTDPTGAGGEEAGMTPMLHSFEKMNVYDEPESRPKGEPVLYSGSHDQFSPEPIPSDTAINPDDPGSTLKSFNSNTRSEDLPQDALRTSSQTAEKISSATSAITDKAVAAKNAVASRLGYGGNGANASRGGEASKLGSVSEYGHKVTATMTEKLAPVYDKVAGVGSSVISKVHGGGTGEEGAEEGQDKGVSVREYLAQKLKPTEEDKALSEIISGALHKQKQEQPDRTPAAGRVTELEEVARRLGSSGDGDDRKKGGDSGAAMSATGKALVDKVKGAVGSWFFGGGYQSGTPQTSSPGGIILSGEERSSEAVGERRLEESGN
ncbi:hypothetical protein NMG60_11022199 [Bertholletia excelsa]